MGWLLISFIFGLIGTGFGYYQLSTNKRKNWRNYLIYTLPWFFMALFFVGFFGSILSMGLSRPNNFDNCKKDMNQWEIVSAVRDKDTTASFILGTGGINTIDRYYVFRVEAKGLILTKYNAHKTYIVEQYGQPKYERIDYICPQPLNDFLWFSSNNTRRYRGITGILFVPKNTILRKFEL